MSTSVIDATARVQTASPVDLDRVQRVAAVVDLMEVALMELSCKRGQVVERQMADVGFETMASGQQRVTTERLYAFIRMELVTTPKTFEIEAVYAVTYELKQTVSEQDAEAFVRINGLFNVWPYWRELVHDVANRMGLVAPMVPLLKR